MQNLRFAWSPRKAQQNLDRHGVSFEEAQTTFYDEFAIEFYDEEHSTSEERFLLLGISSTLRLLIVSHCFRENENVIRIISARKATANESSYYRNH